MKSMRELNRSTTRSHNGKSRSNSKCVRESELRTVSSPAVWWISRLSSSKSGSTPLALAARRRTERGRRGANWTARRGAGGWALAEEVEVEETMRVRAREAVERHAMAAAAAAATVVRDAEARVSVAVEFEVPSCWALAQHLVSFRDLCRACPSRCRGVARWAKLGQGGPASQIKCRNWELSILEI